MAVVDELSQLKRLILGQEQQSLERLQERVERPGTRAQDVAEVLAESFELNKDNLDLLPAAMSGPVKQCITNSVREDPQEFADALFPVIGPAIRKAVSESISALSEKINRALDRSLSPQGIKWRIESLRTGVPVSQIILRDTFIYRVEQAFVIQRDSGLLIAHVARDDVDVQDSDAVSAMLTALQDFVRDSFTAGDGSELDTIRVGGQVVWVFHGPESITAALIVGQPPREMRNIFQEVTESIHKDYGTAIRSFDGEQPSMAGVRSLLQPLLASEVERPNAKRDSKNAKRRLLSGALILCVLILGWFVYRFLEHAKIEKLTQKIADAPGIELISVTPGSPVKFRAFRDPLAEDLQTLLLDTGLSVENTEAEFVPFQSLESELVIKRLDALFDPPETVKFVVENSKLIVSGAAPVALKESIADFPLAVFGVTEIDFAGFRSVEVVNMSELRTELAAPDSVTFHLEQGVAHARGQAPYSWITRVRDHEFTMSEIDALDLTAVEVDEASLIQFLRQETAAPELVELTLIQGRLFIQGGGTFAWRAALEQAALQTGYIDSLDVAGFVPVELEELRALATHISEQKFYFLRSDQLTRGSSDLIESLASDLRRIIDIDVSSEEVNLRFQVRGFADSDGTPEQHETVRSKRADRMQRFLRKNGVLTNQIDVVSGQLEAADDNSQQWRRAEITVKID